MPILVKEFLPTSHTPSNAPKTTPKSAPKQLGKNAMTSSNLAKKLMMKLVRNLKYFFSSIPLIIFVKISWTWWGIIYYLWSPICISMLQLTQTLKVVSFYIFIGNTNLRNGVSVYCCVRAKQSISIKMRNISNFCFKLYFFGSKVRVNSKVRV